MPSVYDLKPRFQSLLRPTMRGMATARMTPNVVTAAALAGSIAVGAAIPLWHAPEALLLLPVWLFVRMALNAIDGMMARELDMASPLGAVLNELGDAISDVGLYLPLAFLDARFAWPVIAFAIGAVLTEFCGVLARALGATRRYDGPMGKSDRAFVVGALALATYFYPRALGIWPLFFWICAALTAVTCVNRLTRALRELRG